MGVRRFHTLAPLRPVDPRATCDPMPRRSNRRLAACAALGLAVLAALGACSREARHQVLVFLYDGVPPLDAADASGAVEEPSEPTSADANRAKTRTYYTHPLFWENRCGSCHDADGRLLRTVREGLCRECHFQKPEDRKKHYHGPVAVNDCLACHRLHRSPYEKILIADPQELCSYCHEKKELVQDRHHATMDKDPCIKCHDPHGGDDRFYLKPGARATDSSQNGLIIEPTP